jgi:hypothetical protein
MKENRTRSVCKLAVSGAVAALAVSGGAESSAYAQTSDAATSSQDARAAELFREGRALREQQRHAEACERFRQSLALKTGSGTLLNVGACFVLENEPVKALETFEQALARAQQAPDGASRKAWSEAAQQEIDALRGQLAEVALRFSATPGLQIHLNNEPIESESWRLRLAPGAYQLRAEAPGREPFTRSISVAAGSRLELSIPPLQPRAQPTQVPFVDESAHAGSSVLPWVLVGTGSGVVIAGAVTGLVASSKAGELEDNCPGGVCPDESQQLGWQGKIDDTKRLALVTNVLWGVGLATLGVGVGWLVFGGEDEPALTATDVQAGCFVGSCGVTLQGRF